MTKLLDLLEYYLKWRQLQGGGLMQYRWVGVGRNGSWDVFVRVCGGVWLFVREGHAEDVCV